MGHNTKVTVWVILNLLIQAIPLWYLYHQTQGKGQFWDFVNCTFLIAAGLGMFIAAYADAVAERCPAGKAHWTTWTVLAIGGTAGLVLALDTEFVNGNHANNVALIVTAICAVAFLIIGTIVKSMVWSHGGK